MSITLYCIGYNSRCGINMLVQAHLEQDCGVLAHDLLHQAVLAILALCEGLQKQQAQQLLTQLCQMHVCYQCQQVWHVASTQIYVLTWIRPVALSRRSIN